MLTTVYCSTANGYVYGNNATYSTARSTAATADDSSGFINVGQKTGFECHEGFLKFDVDAAVGLDYGEYVIQSVTLYMKPAALYDATEFTIEAVTKDWGAGLTTADWVAGASISGTARCSIDTADLAVDTYAEFDAGTWEAAGLSSDGNVYLMLYSTRHKAGTEPTGNEYVTFYSADTADTTSDPYIVVEWYSTDKAGGFLEGALGPVTIVNRAMDAAEVRDLYNLGQVIIDRKLDAGTAAIQGMVQTAAGTKVPAAHVRAGWWIQNLDYDPAGDDKPRPLLITGHSVDADAGKNALTIGVDWMEREVGVKMADVLAWPDPAGVTAEEAADADADMPESDAQSSSDEATPSEVADAATQALSDEYLLTHPWMAPAGYWDTHGENYQAPKPSEPEPQEWPDDQPSIW